MGVTTVETQSKTDYQLHWEYNRADVNIDLNPVPEPSAALLFTVGTLVVRSGIRRRPR